VCRFIYLLPAEGTEMKFARTSITVLLFAALSSAAHAQSEKTREQVKAELAQAIRTGNMPASGDSGLLLNELYPQRYATPAAQAGLTREQVKAELVQAIRTGNMVAAGEGGLKLHEEFPQRYPAVAVAVGKTREQVKAETAEAIRTGDIIEAGESGLKLNQLYPQRYAKARATYSAQARAAE
jgi:hypothetical protein